MSFFNLDKAKNNLSNTEFDYKGKLYGGDQQGCPILKARDLPPAVYNLRFLPGWPERNPDGCLRSVVHFVPTIEGQKSTTVYCNEKMFDTPCAVCDCLRMLIPDFDSLIETHQRVVRTLDARDRTWYVCCIDAAYARPKKGRDDYPDWIHTPGKEQVVIFEVEARTLNQKILDFITISPQALDPQTGFYFAFRKNEKTYDMSPVAVPCPCRVADAYTEKVYPRLTNLLKNTRTWPYQQGFDNLCQSWWAKQLGLGEADPAEVAEIIPF